MIYTLKYNQSLISNDERVKRSRAKNSKTHDVCLAFTSMRSGSSCPIINCLVRNHIRQQRNERELSNLALTNWSYLILRCCSVREGQAEAAGNRPLAHER